VKAMMKYTTKFTSLFWDYIFRHIQKRFFGRPYFHGPRDRATIGKQVSLANTLLNTRSGKIVIGDHVIFGHNVSLLTGVHDYHQKASDRKTIADAGRDIIIEKGAWICSNAIIIGPVRIGYESVVSAGSVVTKDVPKHAIVAGNPAKIVRMLEPSEIPDIFKTSEN